MFILRLLRTRKYFPPTEKTMKMRWALCARGRMVRAWAELCRLPWDVLHFTGACPRCLVCPRKVTQGFSRAWGPISVFSVWPVAQSGRCCLWCPPRQCVTAGAVQVCRARGSSGSQAPSKVLGICVGPSPGLVLSLWGPSLSAVRSWSLWLGPTQPRRKQRELPRMGLCLWGSRMCGKAHAF